MLAAVATAQVDTVSGAGRATAQSTTLPWPGAVPMLAAPT